VSGIPNAKKFTSENASEMGTKGGHNKKGSKHLSTIIKELEGNIDWSKTTLKNQKDLQERYGKQGWKAVVYVAFTKAMTGDVRHMDWLAKNGYGTNIDHTSNGETINVIIDSSYERKPNFRIDNAEADKLATDSQPE
jgi:hypothetical protein